jgi:hypothetical protein
LNSGGIGVFLENVRPPFRKKRFFEEQKKKRKVFLRKREEKKGKRIKIQKIQGYHQPLKVG